MFVKELCNAIAATRKSLITKTKNPNHLEMKWRTKNDNCQRVLVSKNGLNPSVDWSKEEFIF
jgi:hypothetical protein